MRIAIIDTSSTRAAIISDGLRDAGLADLVLIDPAGPLAAQIEAAAPEVVLINLENPSRDLLEDCFAMSRALDRPIAMFVDQSDAEATMAAVDAGVSAYVVDGLAKQRIKPVLDLAVRRFQAFSRLQAELAEAKTALADRATIDRAKAILMKRRAIDEPAAYALPLPGARRTAPSPIPNVGSVASARSSRCREKRNPTDGSSRRWRGGWDGTALSLTIIPPRSGASIAGFRPIATMARACSRSPAMPVAAMPAMTRWRRSAGAARPLPMAVSRPPMDGRGW
jgi:response regulator NasT